VLQPAHQPTAKLIYGFGFLKITIFCYVNEAETTLGYSFVSNYQGISYEASLDLDNNISIENFLPQNSVLTV